MQNTQLIATEVVCTHYQAEVGFIRALHSNGLIELVTVNDAHFIQEEELQKLERIMRLHNDLHINVEGIETIFHLLERVETMQQEMAALRSRVRFYEIEGI